MSFHVFERAGLELRFWDDGHTGLPVVFQHGLCGDEAQVARNFPADPAWRRLTLECRGHGNSAPGPLPDLSIATFTADLIALIEHLGIGQAVVGGISMGAAIALRLAGLRPDLVKGLILVRPAWSLEPAPPTMAPNALVGRLLQDHPQGEARRRFEADQTAAMLAETAPDNLASLRGFFDRTPHTVTAALLRQIAADGVGLAPAMVAGITVPALILAGEHDHIHPLALARDLTARLPAASLTMVAAKATEPERHLREVRDALHRFLAQSIVNST